MSVTLSLLGLVGKAILNAVGGGVAGELLCDVLPDVARNVWERWSKETSESQRRAEVQTLAQASDEEARRLVRQAVDEAAPGQPEEVKDRLVGYLLQVPGCIRQNLRRPADPTGTTVPAGLPLHRASDLLAFLPTRPPRFRPGDRPMHGVDLELVELLGVGGFGEVWKARNPFRPRAEPVALKFCLDDGASAALRNEVDVLDRVRSAGRHPGIVPLLHTYLSAEPPCLEFEYVAGGDLAGLIQEWHAGGKPPTPVQAAKVLRHLAEAVAFAHAQQTPIVHRDLKPANVLVQRDAHGRLHYRISDFGLGALAVSDPMRPTRRSTGTSGYTPLFASPEQMKGEPPATTDDVYALGVIWYQLLSGDLERGAPTGLGWVKELKARGMSEEMIELLASCVSSHAAERPPNAPALLVRLDGCPEFVVRLEEAPPLPHETRPTTRAERPPIRDERPPRRDQAPAPPVKKGPPPAVWVVFGVLGFLLLAMVFSVPILAVVLHHNNRPGPVGPPAVTQPEPTKPLEADFTNSVGMKLVLVRGRRFTMGSPSSEQGRGSDEGPVRQVQLTRPYYLGAFEVTQDEYEKVMGSNPSAFSATGSKAERVHGLDTRRFPVDSVSKSQAEEFCRRLSQREEERQKQRTYRLPTEAEWEFACRAGGLTPFPRGATLAGTDANFDSDRPYGARAKSKPKERTEEVGKYPANPFGLFDMHGNVREWVADGYVDHYDPSQTRNPLVPPAQLPGVTRGGGWSDAGADCRSAARKSADHEMGSPLVGFRVALSP